MLNPYTNVDDMRRSAPLISGVVNITPNSFSDGFLEASAAISHGKSLLKAGAHMLDLGAEASGPGSKAVSEVEEWKRLEPVVEALASKALISIDTYKATTAKKALRRGAFMINDISALRADPAMADIVAEHHCFVVLMYSKELPSSPHVSPTQKDYSDIIESLTAFFYERIDYAISKDIAPEKILLDPGMGCFLSPKPDYSWELLKRLPELAKRFSEFPLFIGTSRKSFLGGAPSERDALSQLTALIAYHRGASVLRTHNVSMAKSFIDAWSRLSM